MPHSDFLKLCHEFGEWWNSWSRYLQPLGVHAAPWFFLLCYLFGEWWNSRSRHLQNYIVPLGVHAAGRFVYNMLSVRRVMDFLMQTPPKLYSIPRRPCRTLIFNNMLSVWRVMEFLIQTPRKLHCTPRRPCRTLILSKIVSIWRVMKLLCSPKHGRRMAWNLMMF